MGVLIPLGHEGVQALRQVRQRGEVRETQALALQDAEPLFTEPILLHFL
jgi:hypothetical protein